ncbi:DUF6765 family protein [Halodesulfovibrio aestuarii]|uniref:Uncharacterized protein n=1 Tax=Halodesulfovibrio aestuarii TaxID=126333 RepID=A0A8G2C8L1_9BACT|nr:DUF6765 family protein [Halodesulfovibrio aestuarii]SHI83359.1 hypothetical protein SAMN05660830_01142 [Halodesulfovibrio aestuarii]
MQLDMHYYGTYAMARAAGLSQETATTIATAAQFVDDNAAPSSVEFRDGGKFMTEATAHHTFDKANLKRDDQRSVWVPFHFLPGNEGETYTEKLICRKNSENAQAVLHYALSRSDRTFAAELIGAAAHLYADTFAHYDFSGVSSRWNNIENDKLTILNEGFSTDMRSYIAAKRKSFFEKNIASCKLFDNICSFGAETFSSGLGHGAACTYPDRPYLVWSFVRERTQEEIRHNNPESFLDACKSLHKFFSDFAAARPDLCSGKSKDFEDIEEEVKRILETPAPMEGRIELWQNACQQGMLTEQMERIPEYSNDGWNDERHQLNENEHCEEAVSHSSYRFYQAVAYLRTYILRDLLPQNGLVVA